MPCLLCMRHGHAALVELEKRALVQWPFIPVFDSYFSWLRSASESTTRWICWWPCHSRAPFNGCVKGIGSNHRSTALLRFVVCWRCVRFIFDRGKSVQNECSVH